MRRLALMFMGITLILSSCGQNLELESIRTLDQGELIGLKGENSTYTSVSYTHLRAHET